MSSITGKVKKIIDIYRLNDHFMSNELYYLSHDELRQLLTEMEKRNATDNTLSCIRWHLMG